jgi:NhaP-type Na+/H+ or K+/H+ antiporter
MVDNRFQQIEKKTWHKYSFYFNIIMFIIIGICIFLTIIDSYNAGKLASSLSSGDNLSNAWIKVMRDVAFLAIALAIVFIQLFRNQWLIMKRSW